MQQQYVSLTLAALGAFLAFGAPAQSNAQGQRPANPGGAGLIQLDTKGKARRQSEAQQVLAEQLPLSTQDQLLPVATEVDPLGFTHTKYQQYHQGYKVEGAVYSVHARQGVIESLSGEFQSLEAPNATPALSEAAALDRALAFVGARQYAWQVPGQEALLRRLQNNPQATYFPKGELVFVENTKSPDADRLGRRALAWKFDIFAQQPMSRAYVYVDARSGEIVAHHSRIHEADPVKGTFQTRHSGVRQSITERVKDASGKVEYTTVDYTRGQGIVTVDAYGEDGFDAQGNLDVGNFLDQNNNWTRAEWKNQYNDDVALDVHWGMQQVFDYWKNVRGRNSYDGQGAPIYNFVHYSDEVDKQGNHIPIDNAFWNGSFMGYGDGNTKFKQVVALDVVAHEMAHAVCQTTAGLQYQSESGAINEALSDIWGAVIEKWTPTATEDAPTKQTWLIGEEIMLSGAALRSMSDPKSLNQPAYYKGHNWYHATPPYDRKNDYGGVHYNSGVMNHWFYILSVGKSGTNEGGRGYNVTGIGMDKAANIVWRAENVYLTPNSNYADAATYTIQAAKDLYGATSAEATAVSKAWEAVGVMQLNYCASKGDNNANEWIDLVKLGSINRTSGKDAGGYFYGLAQSTNLNPSPADPSKPRSTYTIEYSAGFSATAYNEFWHVYIDWNRDGDLDDADETVVSRVSNSAGTLSSTFAVPATALAGATRMRVSVSRSQKGSCGSFTNGEVEDYLVNITGTNGTGSTPSFGAGTAAQLPATQPFAVYPVPASDVLNVDLPADCDAAALTVQVYDVRGAETTAVRYNQAGQLDVHALAPGLYQLHINAGQQTFVRRFTKQ